MARTLRPLSALLLALCILPAFAFAQDFEDLSRSDAGSTLGQTPPLLEIDANFKLVGAKATLWLTEGNTRRKLGVLTQSSLQSLGGVYQFRAEENGPILATLNWKDLTLDRAGKITFHLGDRGQEIGRLRQRIFASQGTGLDVYRKGEAAVGYVDEKAGKTLLQSLLLPSEVRGKYYAFESLHHEKKIVQETKGLFKKRTVNVEKTITTRKEICRFVGVPLESGPAGAFVLGEGRPFMMVQGDWWLSKNIFDLIVTRKEKDGTAGTIGRAAVDIIGLLAGESSGDFLNRKAKQQVENAEPVRNPSAYLGAFLVGLAYFPEFRQAVGVDMPLPTR